MQNIFQNLTEYILLIEQAIENIAIYYMPAGTGPLTGYIAQAEDGVV